MQGQKIVSAHQKTLCRWGLWVLLTLSFSLLAFYQIIYYGTTIMLGTIVLSLPIGFLFFRQSWRKVTAALRRHPLPSAGYACAALMIVAAIFQEKGALYAGLPLPVPLFRLRWMLCAAPALFYLLLWAGDRLTNHVRHIWSGLDQADRRLYRWVSLAASVAVFVVYLANDAWFQQFDVVYSIDSGWCYRCIFPSLSYYDIRHPILSVVTFPLWAVVHTVLGWLVPAQLLDPLCAACLQCVNVQLLLLVGGMLRQMTNSAWTLRLYLASFPSLLFALFFEKYQIAVFFLVLYAFQLCRKQKRTLQLVLAAGTMPISVCLAAGELFQKTSLAKKAKRLVAMALCGIAVLICTGRGHLLKPGNILGESTTQAQLYGLTDYSWKNCFFSLTNMIHGSFLGLPSVEAEGSYTWSNVLERPSLLGLVLLAILLLGIITNRREPFVQLCALWLGVAVVLFCAFQWSIHESPLFSLYFSWALIPLFQKGFQFLVDRFSWREAIAYRCILFPMLLVNLLVLVDIGLFLRAF